MKTTEILSAFSISILKLTLGEPSSTKIGRFSERKDLFDDGDAVGYLFAKYGCSKDFPWFVFHEEGM